MAYYNLKSYKTRLDPLLLFEYLKERPNAFFLDSSLPSGDLGRYSFLGADPCMVVTVEGENPFARLREFVSVSRRARPPFPGLPFWGGAVGYCSYDAGFSLEKKLVSRAQDDLGIPDSVFGIYNTVFVIDHCLGTVSAVCAGFPEKSAAAAGLLCRENLKKAHGILRAAAGGALSPLSKSAGRAPAAIRSNFTRSAYMAAVEKAKAYIAAGDIYQVNLSQRFTLPAVCPAHQLYRKLRRVSPACFGAYFDAGDFQVASSSPERFLSLRGRKVTTRPMKGTRCRGKTASEDERLRQELLMSAKDEAELTMIVDLERNDLGKVCRYGSVRVESMREMEEYSTVYQTTATVAGELSREFDPFDLAATCFPGGSITGCPKIRAMEIIEEIEPQKRSVYTGALGYFSFSGDLDLNILIRSVLQKGGRLYFGAGAGIVADSRPQEEYDETLVKARGFFQALEAR